MPSLIKGANLIWKDSVTIESSIPSEQIKKSNDEKEKELQEKERQQIRTIEERVSQKLEEEYRRKEEGLTARYRLLGEQQKRDNERIALDAKAAADNILEEANVKAMEILGSAQADYENEMAKAREQGYNDGMDVAKEEFLKMMTKLKNVIDGITDMQKYILNSAREEIADIAVSVVRKIMSMDISRSDEVLMSMIIEQMHSFKNYQKVRIYLSGYDIQTDVLADALIANKLLESRDCLTIQNIDEAPEGTCIIETETQMEDISISEQLENLIKNVRNIKIEDSGGELGEYEDDYDEGYEE